MKLLKVTSLDGDKEYTEWLIELIEGFKDHPYRDRVALIVNGDKVQIEIVELEF